MYLPYLSIFPVTFDSDKASKKFTYAWLKTTILESTRCVGPKTAQKKKKNKKPKNNQAPFPFQTAQAPQAYCSIFLEFHTHHLFYARTKPGTNTKRIGPKTAEK